MSGAMGVDMDIRKIKPADRDALAAAIKLYKQDIRDVVEQGDLYRLNALTTRGRPELRVAGQNQRRAVCLSTGDRRRQTRDARRPRPAPALPSARSQPARRRRLQTGPRRPAGGRPDT